MQKKFRRLAAVMLCLTLLAVPALAAEATIDLDYVTIVGEGFAAARLTGSQNNDPMLPGGRFAGNHAGGILGGISSGQDIVLRVGVKPIASIAQEQQTIDVHDQPASVLIGGRHDLAAIPRIVPVLTAMTALVLADALLLQERMAVLPVPDGVDWF